jgi:hypothetical protein
VTERFSRRLVFPQHAAIHAGAGVADTPIEISVTQNRTSGIAPLGVYFDATGTTSPETTLPFQELYYHVDFDDAGDGNWGFGSRSDLDRNEMTGPIAGHVYKTAGNKTPIWTVFDGVDIEQLASDTITVSAADTAFDEIHFFSADTDFAAGTPATGGKYTRHASASWADVITEAQADDGVTKALYLEWGDAFTAAAGYTISKDGAGMIAASPHTGGSSTKPTVTGAFSMSLGSNTNHDFGDWRFVDIEFDGSNDTVEAVSANGAARYMTFLRCEWTNFTIAVNLSVSTLDTINTAAGSLVAPVWNGWLFADCEMTGNTTYNILAPFEQSAILGCNFGAVSIAGGHVIRIIHGAGLAIYANDIINTAGQGTALTVRAVDVVGSSTLPATTHAFTREVVASCNNLQGGSATSAPVTFGVAPSSATDTHFIDLTFEKNWLKTGSANAGVDTSGTYITIRNNLVDSPANGAAKNFVTMSVQAAQTEVPDHIYVYHNTLYSGAGAAAQAVRQVGAVSGSPTNVFVDNNLCWVDAFTGTMSVTLGTFGVPGVTAGTGNSTTTEMNQTNPTFAGSVGDGTGTFTVPNDFKILTGSYAKGDGTDGLKVFDDFFDNIRDWDTPNTDIGFHAFTAGALP